jgi:hypothetical protein
VERLESPVALEMDHEQLEEQIINDGRELQRRLFQAHLDLRAAAEAPTQVVGSDNMERTKRRNSRRPLMSLVGEVAVRRLLYQAVGADGLCPQDAALNLPMEMVELARSDIAAGKPGVELTETASIVGNSGRLVSRPQCLKELTSD